MSERSGGELVAEVLQAAGVRVVFTVLSIHNIPIIDALARDGTIRIVSARTEAGAANMADGYARASGGLGVVITSTGVGAANAAGPLLEAFDAATPVLHLTGQVDSAYVDTNRALLHANPRQLTMLGAVGKVALRAPRTEDVPTTLSEAIRTIFRGRPGPVSVEIPIDQQFRSVNAPLLDVAPLDVKVVAPEQSAIERAVRLLRSAQRPLIWAGGGASRTDDGLVRQLAERLNAGVITTNAGRGAISEAHPLCIGNFSVDDAVVQLLADSDVVLALGTSFRGNETRNWRLPMTEHLMQVDRSAERIGLTYPVEVGLVGEIPLTLRGLLDGLQTIAADPDWSTRVGDARERARQRWHAMLGPHERLLEGLREAVDEDTIVVRDVTVPASAWASRLLEVHRPRTAMHSAALAVGQALSMGVGAALARPERRVVVLVGDGGLTAALGELGTLVQERINLLVVLFNDSGYGILRNLQDAHWDGRRFASDLLTPDFIGLARTYGIQASLVSQAAELGPQVRTAFARGGVNLVEVDLASIGPMAVPFTGAAPLVPERAAAAIPARRR